MHPARIPAVRVLALAVAALVALLVALAPHASAATSVLTPSPSAWDYGSTDIHAGGPTQTFTFTNNTPGTVNVAGVAIVGADPSGFQLNSNGCLGAMLSMFGACDVQVTFAPTATGVQTAALEITDDSGTLDVPLSGTGITGTLSASPNPIQFTAEPYFYGGQQQSITIQDSNDAGVQVTSAVITGPAASLFSIAWGQNCGSQQYGAGNSCNMGINFNPPNGPGTFHAQLEITSDSLASPLIVSISATVLSGPHGVVTPLETDFGDVAIGSAVARTLTIFNEGDFPMQVQGMLMITGTPADLPVTADGCTGQIVGVGSSCQFTVTYRPSAPRGLSATVIVLSNEQGAPIPAGLTGQGVAPVQGSVAVAGHLAAGSALTCTPSGYPGGTSFAYAWLRNGRQVAGARMQHFVLRDADIGARFRCRIDASNSVSSQVATSRQTGAVTPMLLTGEPGAFTDESTCRSAVMSHLLRLGRRVVVVGYGAPVTPWAPLTLATTAVLRARLDGRIVGDGTSITISPQTLASFGDGRHALTVTAAGVRTQARLVLGACALAVRVNGGPGQATMVAASSRYGVSSLTFRLPRNLHLAAGTGRVVGWVTVTPAGDPSRGFNLVGPRTESNAVTVTLGAQSITVTNLPPRTGVVSISLSPGVMFGQAGIVELPARQRGTRTVVRARTPATWLP